MPRLLPLFPLNLVVFPGEKLNLHIFEPRYRELVHDCLAAGTTFGIPPFINNGVSELGTEVQVVAVERTYETGEMDIRTKALGVFRIRQFIRQVPGKLYAAGQVDDITDDTEQDLMLRQRITDQIQQFYEILGLRKLYLDLPANFRIFDIGHHLGFTPEQEYQLLEATSEQERQEIVSEHLDQVLPVVLETERLKERSKLNGHFKNLTPPNF
ncbi:LON peptidase substrate-binding domain-containing protein [Hymenobacter sp. BT175]|uniref:LON peptidase substrate-binding domain-containing protein n=1 Tax=Hymenobacter translucens TaxID=2886507 RepID=UPI001D0EC788|nr:LON peptidase substrate-binding domain-containing protein [Hymenobacter translucens]MCC2544927.1 LON peptidase substrate-binding domain-containing protein [Hymenobacter translucens]